MATRSNKLSPMRRRAVDQLLIQYLELPERAQAAWLRQTVQRLPRLGRWLERLVADSNTVTFLDDSVRRLAGESADRMEINIRRLAPGDRLGPWEVTGEVGQGGMGRVYRGRRADGAFDMEVAIKQIGRRRRGLAELLQRECQLLARLDHPSITRLVDAGLDDQAGPFLVMEWVEGEDLADWIQRQKPDQSARLKLFKRIGEAVAHAHQRLIVHGDIKPDNIRIRDDGTVKLMDFGVARLVNSDEPTAVLRGLTPSFSAPEQLEGAPISTQSDIWSLGALLYWLLTGTAIPRKLTAIDTGIRQAGHARADELLAILKKACDEAPERRYQSVASLIDDIQRFGRHRPLAALPLSRLRRSLKFIRRNPLPVATTTLAFLALLSGLLMSTSMYLEGEAAREIALQERDRAEQTAEDLAQVADFQRQQLAELDTRAMGEALESSLIEQLIRPPGSDADRDLPEELQAALANVSYTTLALDALEQHLFRRTLEAINAEFGDQALLRAQLLQTLTEITRRVGLLDLAGEALSKALALRREHLGDLHPDTLISVHDTGHLRYLQADGPGALEYLTEALAGRREVLGEDNRFTLDSIYVIGVTKHMLGDLDGAMDHYQKALQGRIRVLGTDHRATLMSKYSVGVLYRFIGEYESAMRYQSRALEGFRVSLGEDHAHTLAAHSGMGYLLAALGDIEQSLDFYRESLAGRRRVQGDRHPLTLWSFSDVGVTLMLLDRYDEARPYLEQALAGRMETLGPDNAHTIFSVRFMGLFHKRTGKPQKAEALLRKALDWRLENIGRNSANTHRSKMELARALTQLQREDEALELVVRATLGFERALGPEHEESLAAADKLARLSADAESDRSL